MAMTPKEADNVARLKEGKMLISEKQKKALMNYDWDQEQRVFDGDDIKLRQTSNLANYVKENNLEFIYSMHAPKLLDLLLSLKVED